MLCLQVLVNGADSFSRFLFAFSTLFLHAGLVLMLNTDRAVRISQSRPSIAFFNGSYALHFCIKKTMFASLWICWVCLFFCAVTHICASCFCYEHLQLSHTNFCATIPPQWSSLTIITIPENLILFLPLNTHSKTYPTLALWVFLPCFSFPCCLYIHSHRMEAHLHPCSPICDTIYVLSQNMMSGEISPAIGLKAGSVRQFLSLHISFVCPLILPGPQRTHTSPSRPIHTYVYSCTHPFCQCIQ